MPTPARTLWTPVITSHYLEAFSSLTAVLYFFKLLAELLFSRLFLDTLGTFSPLTFLLLPPVSPYLASLLSLLHLDFMAHNLNKCLENTLNHFCLSVHPRPSNLISIFNQLFYILPSSSIISFSSVFKHAQVSPILKNIIPKPPHSKYCSLPLPIFTAKPGGKVVHMIGTLVSP